MPRHFCATASKMLRPRLYAKHDVDGLKQLDSEIGTALPDMSDGVRWLLAAVRGAPFSKPPTSQQRPLSSTPW